MTVRHFRRAPADQRHRCLHMTIRDIDCADFDVQVMIDLYRSWNVTLFSFFAGGYVTTYPTRIPWQRVSRYLAPGRDLCGEIIEAAHRAGMIAIPMIDLGEIPEDVARQHPEWCAQNADGSLKYKTDTIVTSCALGHYRRECGRELVTELKERYGAELDGLKWGGASYVFPPAIDYNPAAVERFLADTGVDRLPSDPKDPVYDKWRQEIIFETARYLTDMVHELADVPTVGNSVWHLGEGMDLEDLIVAQDLSQVEIQTRTFPTGDDAEPAWQRFSTPLETTRYVTQASTQPPLVVASYFLAWPWRRVAVPWPEQKIYLAQVAANGGAPMVNLTTGAPQHHQDHRGFRAIDELYGFMARHADLYNGDHSAARVALIYDHNSARAASEAGDLYRYYLREFHAIEDILDRWHIPYDIVSTRMLANVADGSQYSVLILPHAPCLNQTGMSETIFQTGSASQGGVVATGLPAANGPGREEMEALFGCNYQGSAQRFTESKQGGLAQAYLRVDKNSVDPGIELLEGIETSLLAAGGHWYPVEEFKDDLTHVPLRRAEPFRLFPEGISYTLEPDPGEPMMIARENKGRGRTVLLPFDAGRCAAKTGHPDNERIIVNAVRWAARGALGLEMHGAPDVRISLRRSAADDLVVHLINTTGRHRYLTEFNPVRNLHLRLTVHRRGRIYQASTGRDLEGTSIDQSTIEIVLPELIDYDLIILEKAMEGVTRR